KIQHYAVDIAVSKSTPVKAVADGRVVLASWTSDSGFVIIIDHGNQMLSVYKHNAALTKEQGDLVKAQEVIARSGSSGKLSTGPHLHFELWNDGNPIDPSTFIDF
ncbi:MAG: M23 family metallopeptidase, partial [Bacteroidota bacterium]|nr:M23 family metallopeptidase [Bacteroidota bacterium]